MNIKRLVIIIILLLIVLGFIIWFVFWQQRSPRASPISLIDSHGQKTSTLNVLDAAAIRVEKLKPNTHYDIRILRSDGIEISHARLTTDSSGTIPLTQMWYDIGVVYNEGSRVGKLDIKSVVNYGYQIIVSGPGKTFKIPFKIAELLHHPRFFSADSNGNPLNAFIKGKEDVYAIGKNFPAGSAIRIYVTGDKYSWDDGDELMAVNGNYITVNLTSNQTDFKVLIWSKNSTRIGSYDIIADCSPMDGLFSKFHTDPNDGDCNVGFCVQNDGGSNHIEQQVTCQAPVPPPPSAPNPKYKDAFSTSEEVWVAVNPYTQSQNYVGKNARIYVVNHLTEADWVHGTALNDVSGGYEETVIQPGCANVNYTLIWPNPVAGKYDVVVDFDPFGVYDKGTDIVDMLDQVGLLVGDGDMEVTQIKFNWGTSSGATNLWDHITNSSVPAPEWDKTINRNEPAAYKRGSTITIKAQFHKISATIPNTVVVWAEPGYGISLSPQTITFDATGYSGYVDLTASTPLLNYVNKNDYLWQWYYAVPPYPGSVKNPINVTTHTICTTFNIPIVDPAYKEPMLWTSEWARYQSNEKGICDAIIHKLYLSGLKYGIAGWSVEQILDNGGGMCGGWYKMFFHMAGCQGVFVYQKFYSLQTDAAASPEIKWNAIVIKDGGLNQPQPTPGVSTFHDVDLVYPNPQPSDVVDRSEKRYKFTSPDGHCINFLDYQGALYLYDPSFGKGPYTNTFTTVPSGDTKGTELTNFRANYHDAAINYMLGYIKLSDGSYKYLTIKTTLIPDLRNPGDPSTFEMHYKWN